MFSSRFGIPTTYKGIRFRSRLEAKWAKMFDWLEWPWHYEPIDLNGYIPDFIINFPEPMLVEIKPDFNVDGLKRHTNKIDRNWKKEALVLGSILPMREERWNVDHPVIGILNERGLFGLDHWMDAVLFECGKCRKMVPASIEGAYKCRQCGAWDGDHYFCGVNINRVMDCWSDSCNETQWKAGAQ